MKNTDKQLLGIVAVSTLVIVVSTGVFAQGGFGSGYNWGGHHGMMGGYGSSTGPVHMVNIDYAEFADQRLSRLKDTIGITAEQEPAWNAYAVAIKDKAELMQSHRSGRFETSQVNTDQIQTFHQQGLTQLQKAVTASLDLYAVLTPVQQAKAGNLVSVHYGLR